MPRPICLPTLPFHPYYFFRTTAKDRTLINNRAEVRLFTRMLTATLANSGAHLHFAYIDEKQLHLGVYSGERSLNEELGRLCQRYARAINRVRGERDALFRPHAHLCLVQPGKWFLQLGRYIHWIPRLESSDTTRSRISWSTDALYRNRVSVRGLLTTPTFRALSRGSRTLGVQDRAYRNFFDQRPTQKEVDGFKQGSPEDPRIVGDLKFVREISKQFGLSADQRPTRRRDAHEEIRRTTQTLIEEFRALCDKYLPRHKALKWKQLSTFENVCSKRRTQPLPMIRGLSASYVVGHKIATLRQIERFFSCRRGTLSAARRHSYKEKFRHQFNRPYEQLLTSGDADESHQYVA